MKTTKTLTLANLLVQIKSTQSGSVYSACNALMESLDTECVLQEIVLDSRRVGQGDVFILLASQSSDVKNSAKYALSIVDKAAVIFSEVTITDLIIAEPALKKYTNKIAADSNIRQYLGSLIASFKQLKQLVDLPLVLAVTGTNGKTTISQLAAQLIEHSGKRTAIMGTAGNGRLGKLEQSTHTTGDVLAVQTFLHKMAADKVEVLSLEASSHGLYQHRLQALPVKVAIYTNLSRDHLDYHSDMDDYANAKARLFNKNYFPELSHAIINLDDYYAEVMLEAAQASNVEHIWTYSLDMECKATFIARSIKPSLEGVQIELLSDFGQLKLNSPLLGRFNVANLLAAIAAAFALGSQFNELPKLVDKLQGADGRMDRVASNKGCFIVDYAHTPDALTQVLKSLKSHCEGELWAVFGCGGDRDKGKRPLMAQAGLADADKVILTSDNPRSEEPEDILRDMQVGMSVEQYKRTHIETERKAAIDYAVVNAAEQDIVVIAGKGHETYQEIKGVRYDFDDRVVLAAAIENFA